MTALAILIAAGVAFGISVLVVPAARSLAHRLGIVDRPDALLKPHAKPIAYLGGAAFYLAWLVGLAAIHVLDPRPADPRMWAVAALGGVILLVGLFDDIRGVTPWHRLLAEAVVGALLFVFGVRFMGLPLEWPALNPTGLPGQAVCLALQVAVVVGACNATNLLDGLDGLCGGVSAIVLLGLAALAGGAMVFHRAELLAPGNTRLVIMLALPLAGALAGFLVYNYNPASIFMGDAGSLLLGFAVAACIALLGVPGWMGLGLSLAGLVAFALPICDAGLAFVRRKLAGKPIFAGDRSHFYDQLIDRGVPVRKTVNACYMLSSVFVGVAWIGAVEIARLRWALLLYALLLGTVILLLVRHGFVRAGKP